MKQCPICHSAMPDQAKFCIWCGNPFRQQKSRKKGLIFGICGAAVLVVAVLILAVSGVFSREGTLTLTADTVYRAQGACDAVTFTATVGRGSDEVWLQYADGERAGRFHDDGNGGDDTANDGVFTFVLEEIPEQKTAPAASTGKSGPAVLSASFRAAAGKQKSALLEIFTFQQPDEQQKKEMMEYSQNVQEEIRRVDERYADGSGTIPPEKQKAAADEVEQLIRAHVSDGGIFRFEREDNSIYIKYSSGIAEIYEPRTAETSAGGDGVELTLWDYQPNPDIKEDVVSQAMQHVGNKLDDCSYVHGYSGSEVTLDLIKGLPDHGVVFWNGHGGHGPIVKSFLFSGEAFDWEAWWRDWNYYSDCVSDRILRRKTEHQKDVVCFTKGFVEYYCGNLSGSLFLLASCESAKSDELANAFLAKGTGAVIGFTDTVYTQYCLTVCTKTLGKMTEIDSSTKRYYTLSSALDAVKQEYGKNDREFGKKNGWSEKPEIAEPKLYGDSDFRLSKIIKGKTPKEDPFAQVVRDYEDRYGKFEIHKASVAGLSSDYYTGVFLLKLLDFDEDGFDELIIGYAEETIANGISQPKLDVWRIKDGKALQAWDGATVTHSDVGSHCGYAQLDGIWHLVKGHDGSAIHLDFLRMKNGEFKRSLELVYDEEAERWYYNGSHVDADEGWRMHQDMYEKTVKYHGVILDYYGETEESLRAGLEETKKQLGLE